MPVVSTELRFSGKNGRDEFHREQIADKVIRLLVSDIEISPMVIDGQWGTGKTEFCHKLINKFRDCHPNYRLLYVDAFQADHADNPLMTILAEVLKLLPEGEQRKEFLKKALPVVRYGLKTVLKAVAGHILHQNADDIAESLGEHLQDAADTVIDASIAAVLKDHEKAEANLRALQSALANIASDSPIVLFIDELDRCRPDFAVQMLEVIKHTFNVENVKFVLIANMDQLRAAINHRYGSLVDAQRYLDKFLKFSFRLPSFVEVAGRQRDLASVKHFRNLVKESSLLKETDFSFLDGLLDEFAKSLIIHNRLSLREVETLIRHMEIFQTLSRGIALRGSPGNQLLSVFGVFVFCFSKDVEESIHANKTDAVEIAKLLGLSSMPVWNRGGRRPHPTEVIAIFLARGCAFNRVSYQLNSQQEREYWEPIFLDYFNNTGFEEREPFRAVRLAIECLSLAE